jgi:hypothetical protein
MAITLEFFKENKLGEVFTVTGREYFEVIIPTGSASFDTSFLAELGLGLRVDVLDRVSVYLTPTIVYDGGEYGGVHHTAWRTEAGVEYEITSKLTLGAYATLYEPLKAELEDEMTGCLKAGYEF